MGAEFLRNLKLYKMKKPKNNFVIFRVNDAERRVIQDHAKKQGKSVSSFMRDTFSTLIKQYTNESRI